MAEKSNPYIPRLCIKNCGFYGNATTLGMCSKCFKDQQKATAPKQPTEKSNSNQHEVHEFNITKENLIKDINTPGTKANDKGPLVGWNMQKYAEAMKTPFPRSDTEKNIPKILPPGTSLNLAKSGKDSKNMVQANVSSLLPPPGTPKSPSSGTIELFLSSSPAPSAAASILPMLNSKRQLVEVSKSCKPQTICSTESAISCKTPEVDGLLSGQQTQQQQQQRGRKRRRCDADNCTKKIEVIAFDCRCGKKFCNTHRYAKDHHCGFDYKTLGAEQIAKALPKCIADKIRKI